MMRRLAVFAILRVSSVSLIAQSATQPQHRSVGKELDVWVSKTEEHLVAAADAMPEEKEGFAPTACESSGVRTFGVLA